MPKRKSRSRSVEGYNQLVKALEDNTPQLFAWLDDRDDFLELRLKAKPDGTILAIAKGFDASGGPVVCFGVGFDVVGALVAINGTITSANWRYDKPWQPKSG